MKALSSLIRIAMVDPTSPESRFILLAEDEPVLLKMITTMLQRLGYSVLAASTPSQAIKYTRELNKKLDLVITDVIMPDMNGRELAERIMEILPGTRLLYMSGHHDNIIADQGVLNEGVFFIQKPFSQKQLATKILEVLGNEE